MCPFCARVRVSPLARGRKDCQSRAADRVSHGQLVRRFSVGVPMTCVREIPTEGPRTAPTMHSPARDSACWRYAAERHRSVAHTSSWAVSGESSLQQKSLHRTPRACPNPRLQPEYSWTTGHLDRRSRHQGLAVFQGDRHRPGSQTDRTSHAPSGDGCLRGQPGAVPESALGGETTSLLIGGIILTGV